MAPLARVPRCAVDRAEHPYDDCMKRLTVSLPDDLVERIRRAAGGEGQVSSYVARALSDFTERESLDEVIAAWAAETPVDDETRRQVAAEHDAIGLTGTSHDDGRAAG